MMTGYKREVLDLFLKAKKMDESLSGIDTLIVEIKSEIEMGYSSEL